MRSVAHCLCNSKGTLVTLTWPPPAERSLFWYDPLSGRATIVEIDVKHAVSLLSRVWVPLSDVAACSPGCCGGGAWIFNWHADFDHTLAMPWLPDVLLILQYSSASGKVVLRMLQMKGGRTKPTENVGLNAHLQSLVDGAKPTHSSLASDDFGRLLFLRYCSVQGSAAIDALTLQDGCSSGCGVMKPLSRMNLSAGHEVTRLLPVCRGGESETTVFQYDDRNGHVCVWGVNTSSAPSNATHAEVHAERCWESRWVSNYPNQQVVSISGAIHLVKYNPATGQLSVGRFGEDGAYRLPDGDLWKCEIGGCKQICGVWTPTRNSPATVLLESDTEGDFLLCTLPNELCANPYGYGICEPDRVVRIRGPIFEEMITSIRAENWRNRCAAVLLSQVVVNKSQTHGNLAWILQEIRALDLGIWKELILML